MLSEIIFEAFQFLARDDLDRCEAATKSWRELIVGSSKLALRRIYEVDVISCIMIFVTTSESFDEDAEASDYRVDIAQEEFEAICSRLRNTFIKHCFLDCSQREFLRHWLDADLDSHVEIIGFDCAEDNLDMVDLAVKHFEPSVFETEIDETAWTTDLLTDISDDDLALLSRDSLRSSVKTCRLHIFDNALPPPSYILSETRFQRYELHCFDAGYADWIDMFIGRFENGDAHNRSLGSVAIHFAEDLSEHPPSPQRLREPTKTGVPIPRDDFVMDQIRGDYEQMPCNLYSFVSNGKCQQQLDIYSWTVDWKKKNNGETYNVSDAYLFIFRRG